MSKSIRSLFLGIVTAFPIFASAIPVSAASASLSLSPASSSVSKGSTLTVSIRENSGSEPVNSVQANLSYPANLFDYVSTSNSSAWGVIAETSGGGGSVRVARGANPAVTGSQVVATVRFKAKTDTGTASISFASGSAVVSANDNKDIMSGSSGGSYILKAPAPAAAPAVEAPKDTAPPTIDKVEAIEITATTAVITWITSEPASSEVVYGPSEAYGLSASDGALVTDHKLTLSSPLITPGTKYNYIVKSKDAAGNATSSPNASFTTVGGVLIAKVVNQKNKPVFGAKVTFGEISAVTDKKGEATLKNLPVGQQTGTVTYKGKQTPASVNIEKVDASSKPVNATYKIDTSSDLWLKIVILLLLASLVGLFFYRRRGGGRVPPSDGSAGGNVSKAAQLLAGLRTLPKRLKDLLPKKETRKSSNIDQISPITRDGAVQQPQNVRPNEGPNTIVAPDAPKQSP